MIKTCSRCKEEKEEKDFRVKKINGSPTPNYKVKVCISCERELTKQHQQNNREYWRAVNKKAHLKKVGVLTRCPPKENTLERIAQRARDKSNARCTRAKQARFLDELTTFVTKEAHELRKLRNTTTGIEWHVDHIVPLTHQMVCGLHVWCNLQVIPKILNLKKGNSLCLI